MSGRVKHWALFAVALAGLGVVAISVMLQLLKVDEALIS